MALSMHHLAVFHSPQPSTSVRLWLARVRVLSLPIHQLAVMTSWYMCSPSRVLHPCLVQLASEMSKLSPDARRYAITDPTAMRGSPHPPPLVPLHSGLTNAPYEFMSGDTYLNPLRASLPTPTFPETTFPLDNPLLFRKHAVEMPPPARTLNVTVILGRPFPAAFPSGRDHVCGRPCVPCQPASRRASGREKKKSLHTCYEQHG